jgi:transposase
MRYAGLNIRRRQSGTYEGLNKISKKGRPLLRKILYQAAFSSFTGNNKIFNKIYEEKKSKINDKYAKTVIMRKSLKMIFGTFKNQNSFDYNRVHVCKYEYIKPKAAA